MTSLDTTLAEAITPPNDHIVQATTDADWARIERTVVVRARRRSAAFRVATLGFLILGTLAAFGALQGSGLDTVPDTAAPAQAAVEAGTSVWPTTEEVATEAGERPRAQTWLAWLLAFGGPLALGVRASLRAPAHLRADVPAQRCARLVLASATGLIGAASLGIGLGLVLVVWYDPLAAQTGTSLLLSMVRVVRISLYCLVSILVVSHQAARLTPGSSVWRSASFLIGAMGWTGLWLIPVSWIDLMVEGGFGWHRTVGAAGPTRGLWRLFVGSDGVTHLNASGAEVGVNAWPVLAFVTVGAVGVVWISRSLIRAVLAGDRFGPVVWPAGNRRWFTFGLVTVGLALPLLAVIGRDAHAQSVAHLVTVPVEVGSEDQNVRVERNIIENPFEDWTLVEVVLEGSSSRSVERLRELRDEQLLRPEFGFIERGDGYWRYRNGGPQTGPSNREYWSIERTDSTVIVRGEADPLSQSDWLNEALFVGAFLLLAGTSRRLNGAGGESVAGRAAAGWLSLGLSIWLLGGLVRSIVRVEELLVPIGGSPTINLLDQATSLEVHRLWSPGVYVAGVFGFGAGAFVPAAALGLAALYRLTNRRSVVALVGVVLAVGVVEVQRRWGLVIDVGNDLVE